MNQLPDDAVAHVPRRHEPRNSFRLVTPEGVPLSLEIALAGDRITAFLLDSLIVYGTIVLISLGAALVRTPEVGTLSLVLSFLLRNFYFMVFEQRWQGATPGKRNRRLRVIDAQGGQLAVEAVIVRNLTREVEIFIPLAVLFFPEGVWPEAPPFVPLVAGLWVLVLGLMPLFNRQRRRVGDLIAGTIVIAAPQVELLGDLADPDRIGAPGPAGGAGEGFTFAPAQLGVYGVYELQVLEKVLRRSGLDNVEAQMGTIREKICARIGWEGEVKDDYGFLKAFYAAQRAHLEGRLLMGQRREDKFDGTVPAAEENPD